MKRRKKRKDSIIDDSLCALDWSNIPDKTYEEEKQEIKTFLEEKKVECRKKNKSEDIFIKIIKKWIDRNKGEDFKIWKEVLEEEGYYNKS